MWSPSWGTRIRRWFTGWVWREYEVVDQVEHLGPGRWKVLSTYTVGIWTKRGDR